MTRNHRQNDHAGYDNKQTRRVDDYRPATLKRFWQAFQDAAWSARKGFTSAVDLFIYLAIPAVAIGAVVASGYVLWNLIR